MSLNFTVGGLLARPLQSRVDDDDADGNTGGDDGGDDDDEDERLLGDICPELPTPTGDEENSNENLGTP